MEVPIQGANNGGSGGVALQVQQQPVGPELQSLNDHLSLVLDGAHQQLVALPPAQPGCQFRSEQPYEQPTPIGNMRVVGRLSPNGRWTWCVFIDREQGTVREFLEATGYAHQDRDCLESATQVAAFLSWVWHNHMSIAERAGAITWLQRRPAAGAGGGDDGGGGDPLMPPPAVAEPDGGEIDPIDAFSDEETDDASDADDDCGGGDDGGGDDSGDDSSDDSDDDDPEHNQVYASTQPHHCAGTVASDGCLKRKATEGKSYAESESGSESECGSESESESESDASADGPEVKHPTKKQKKF